MIKSFPVSAAQSNKYFWQYFQKLDASSFTEIIILSILLCVAPIYKYSSNDSNAIPVNTNI